MIFHLYEVFQWVFFLLSAVMTPLKPSTKFSFAEKDSVLIVYREFSFQISIIYYQMQTNIQKKILRGRKNILFGGRSLAIKLQDGSGLKFTKLIMAMIL